MLSHPSTDITEIKQNVLTQFVTPFTWLSVSYAFTWCDLFCLECSFTTNHSESDAIHIKLAKKVDIPWLKRLYVIVIFVDGQQSYLLLIPQFHNAIFATAIGQTSNWVVLVAAPKICNPHLLNPSLPLSLRYLGTTTKILMSQHCLRNVPTGLDNTNVSKNKFCSCSFEPKDESCISWRIDHRTDAPKIHKTVFKKASQI